MKGISEVSEKNVSIMILIVKIAIIFFTEIAIYNNLSNYFPSFVEKNVMFNLYAMIILVCNIMLIYVFWFIIIKNKSMEKKYNLLSWIETSFFIAFLSFSMYLSNSYESQVKYIFVLLIITTVIQYDLRYGMIITLISSFIILGFDFVYAPITNGINKNFEGDLIITGIYIFITWVLGYYVEIEREYKLRTTEQLHILSSELEESDKSRHYIEEVLLKNNMCFEMLFENAENAILVHEDGKIFYANERAAKLLGYDNAEKLNEIFMYEHYPITNKELIKNKYINICNENLYRIIEDENILDCLGNSILVRNTSSFFIYEGKPAVLTFLLDITSEKQIENLIKNIEINEKLLNETREYNVLGHRIFHKYFS
jgi:PAS domain S-box